MSQGSRHSFTFQRLHIGRANVRDRHRGGAPAGGFSELKADEIQDEAGISQSSYCSGKIRIEWRAWTTFLIGEIFKFPSTIAMRDGVSRIRC
ncbi:MAG: hypothetical protein JWO15_3339 [Sphingomonadales bacterium]|nr:hypothetical protein [Sphingomonadales bacterium]